jgi:serine/threonine protein kinase
MSDNIDDLQQVVLMAVKIFRPAKNAKYLREREKLQILKTALTLHKNIQVCFQALQIGSVTSQSYTGYIFSQWAATDLHHALLSDKIPRDSKEQKLEILYEFKHIVSAVNWLHQGFNTTDGKSFRLWHLDLKPANILVFPANLNFERWRLNDFGCSHSHPCDLESPPTEDDPPRAVAEVQDGAYSPPEANMGDHYVQASYDVWSLGCIFLDVIGFISGGSTAVETLQEFRGQSISGDFATQFFCKSNGRFKVKPKISGWFREQISRLDWPNLWKTEPIAFLQPDHTKRKSAADLCDCIHHLLEALEGSDHEYVLPNPNPPEPFQLNVTEEAKVIISTMPTEIEQAELSRDGQWALYRTQFKAYALRLNDLDQEFWREPDRQYDVVLARWNCKLFLLKDHRVEAVAASHDTVAILFTPLHWDETSTKKVEVAWANTNGRKTVECASDAYGITVSPQGSCLLLRNDNVLDLWIDPRSQNGSGVWKAAQLRGQSIRAAEFSHDGRSIYAWSRAPGLNHHHVFGIPSRQIGQSYQGQRWSRSQPFVCVLPPLANIPNDQ